jgi:toxin CcdB
MSRQFDIHANRFAKTSAYPPFLVNLQSDHLSLLRTVVIAPLSPEGQAPPIHVPIRFQRSRFWLTISELAYVRLSSLGEIVGRVAAERDRIIRPVDLLLTGV